MNFLIKINNYFLFSNNAIIYGVDEYENDNIVATGLVIGSSPFGGYQAEALLLKVLANGCFTPNCNGGAEDTLIIASTVVGVEQ